MRELPISETYEEELEYFPYKSSLDRVIKEIRERAPRNGNLTDLMCGPGYLLGKIAEARGDLSLTGMDLDKRYIDFAKQKYPNIHFEEGDVQTWGPKKQSDIVICTGSLHHIPYEKQKAVLEKMSKMVKPRGFGILSDCHVDEYHSEVERQAAAARLGYEYLNEAIWNLAPNEVLSAAIDILHNDVMKDEFKTSIKDRVQSVEKFFKIKEMIKTWPTNQNEDSTYGDYILVLESKKPKQRFNIWG